LQRANASFTQGDWKAALEAYRALSTEFPTHALSRFRTGVSQLELGQLADAEKNLHEGERLGMPAAQAAYRLAQLRAEQQRPEEAMTELARSIGAGLFIAPSALTSDRHLATLKTHPRWPGVMDALDATLRPCLHDPRFREFDFWVGDWDVRPTNQPPAGPPARNQVTIEDNGCVVMEHWNSPSGSEGQSFNIFDRAIGKWRQTWVDNQGGQHDYRGGLRNGDMAFVGETPAVNGALGHVPTRLTFFHLGPDSVRQFSETSPDSGRTWQVSYDLMYLRRPGSSGAKEALDRLGIRNPAPRK
jgi:hypothetical protein